MAVDFFLKIDGIDGESQDAKHKNEIDVLSWSFGASNTGTMAFGGGGGAGKVAFQDFSFVHRVDKATPKLQLANWQGSHIPTMLLTVRKSGTQQQEFMTYKFSSVLVSSTTLSGQGGGDEHPMEQVSVNFAKVELMYKPQKVDGTLDAAINSGWDLKGNVKV